MSTKKLVVSTYLQYILIALATLATTALYGIIGAVFAVPIVAIIAATLRYLRGTLLFERWRKPPAVAVVPEESPATAEEASVRDCVEGKR